MSITDKSKIVIIGAGNVGEAVCYTLMVRRQASEIVLVDINGAVLDTWYQRNQGDPLAGLLPYAADLVDRLPAGARCGRTGSWRRCCWYAFCWAAWRILPCRCCT